VREVAPSNGYGQPGFEERRELKNVLRGKDGLK